MLSNLKILPLCAEHSKPLVQLEKEIFSDEPWSEQAFLSESENRFSKSLVAIAGKQIVGYIMASCVCGDGCINNIAVEKNYRGMGIASLLIERFINETTDCEQISLEVRQSNHMAKKLYEKHQFQVVGVRNNFYINPCEDADLMIKKLR